MYHAMACMVCPHFSSLVALPLHCLGYGYTMDYSAHALLLQGDLA